MEKEPKIKGNEKLREELITMMDEDQKAGETHDWKNYFEVVRKRNTERLKEIISEYGWPGFSLVGKDGSRAAWLLAQHSDHDLEFQKQALGLLKKAVKKEDASKRNLVYLTDRVLRHSGKPQLFGTQFEEKKDGKWGPQPIEDPEHLDERRKKFGLEPFSEYEKIMEELHKK